MGRLSIEGLWRRGKPEDLSAAIARTALVGAASRPF
jgi:hypothetical protein